MDYIEQLTEFVLKLLTDDFFVFGLLLVFALSAHWLGIEIYWLQFLGGIVHVAFIILVGCFPQFFSKKINVYFCLYMVPDK